MKSLTTWEYSVDVDAERILHAAHQIVIGFYKINNFIVLPYAKKPLSVNQVVFPNLEYSRIPKFWKKVVSIEVDSTSVKIDPLLKKDLVKLLAESDIKRPSYNSVKDKWQKAENEVIKTIYEILPEKRNAIKKINIFPSCFCTSCSSTWINKQGEINIYLREDQGISAITEAIITSLTRDDIYKNLNGVWQESEIITDFLITQTKLAKVIHKYENPQKYIPTLKGTRTKDLGALSQISDKYYKELNIPNFDGPFSLNGLTPEINKKPIFNLNLKDKKIMYELIKNSNDIVNFEVISDILFENTDNFSLFAQAKVIQRLREKLERNGISGSFIQTVRGKGYLLKN